MVDNRLHQFQNKGQSLRKPGSFSYVFCVAARRSFLSNHDRRKIRPHMASTITLALGSDAAFSSALEEHSSYQTGGVALFWAGLT